MISHEYRCIFIHIPKCAGTSIEKALGHLDGHVGRGGQDHRTIRMIEQPIMNRHAFMTTENLSQHWLRARKRLAPTMNPRNKRRVTKQQYRDYLKFTFVRNPWARAYSWYRNVMRDPVHKNHLRITDQLSLRDFLLGYAGREHLKPQTYWIQGFDGSIPLDYIGKFENLSEDFQKICDMLDVSSLSLPHEIKSSSSDYREAYDDESRAIVQSLYGPEIEMFEYSFDS